MSDIIFLCGDNIAINGEHIIEVDFDSKPGVWISFVDGSRKNYNVCTTNILLSYLKEHEIEYKNLDDMSQVKPAWKDKENKSYA